MLIVDKDKQEAIKITDCKIKVISGKKKIKKEIKKHRKTCKTDLVKCPNCNGRGQIGYGIKGACFDFECDYCKGRGVVSKKRFEKYGQENKNGLLWHKEVDS